MPVTSKPSLAALKRQWSAGAYSPEGRGSTDVIPKGSGPSTSRLVCCRGLTVSALFTRGETQALVVTTLGTGRDAQIIDALEGERKDQFMLHYNFPPYCVGETAFMTGPKRREIGHGRLARRGMEAVLPRPDDFPYVIRVVSEITESNGSSSMASVCGTSLSLMDAGVPIAAPVAGVAMGLVKEGDDYVVLTDILGDEDHLGDMDFKVCRHGQGHYRAADGHQDRWHHRRDHGRCPGPGTRRPTVYPQQDERRDQGVGGRRCPIGRRGIITIKIDPEKIRDVIGKGGAVIRAMTEETGATIDVENDGTVRIASVDGSSGREAQARIELITADVEVGRIYEGKVVRLMDFGCIRLHPPREGWPGSHLADFQ